MCKSCFIYSFEEEVHDLIVKDSLLNPDEVIAVGASGGKGKIHLFLLDSTVLIHILHVLNQRHNYNIKIHLLSIDEGIQGYRDYSLDCVRRNSEKYNLPLSIFSFKVYLI